MARGRELVVPPLPIYSYYTRWALIRDRQPTAWDDFARPAEAETTCIRKVSHQIVVERFLKFNVISVISNGICCVLHKLG